MGSSKWTAGITWGFIGEGDDASNKMAHNQSQKDSLKEAVATDCCG